MFIVGQGFDRRCPHPGAQYTIESRGDAAPLSVANDCQARLIGMGRVNVLVELSGGECGPFRCYHDEVRLALLVGFSDELKELIWVGLKLGYEYRLRPTRNGAHKG